MTGNARNIGFVSTRVSGTDGVSLEIGKWAEILTGMGHRCYYVCGRSDRPADRTFLIPEADFKHPQVLQITRQAFGRQHRHRDVSRQVLDVGLRIKDRLYAAIDALQLDLLIAQNSLTIPLNIPLGMALVEVLIETGTPCIAHHHDFAWERERFLVNSVDDYLHAAFPPQLHQIQHVVINTLAGEEFSRRTGLPYRIIPNVMDFAQPPPPPDDYADDLRRTIGLRDDDLMILQPTRVVHRKGIEHTVELVRWLEDPRAKVVITHSADDEGPAYARRVQDFARLLGVQVVFADRWVSDCRGTAADGYKCYSVWDAYQQADLVAYPSTYEGFGNAFLEAVYHRKPIFCNRYAIFATDIEPCGFETIAMDGFLTADVVDRVRQVLADPAARQAMVDHNYETALRHFSYRRAEEELQSMLAGPLLCHRQAE